MESETVTRNTERTRRAILTEATRLFEEKGPGTAIADIATAAGVSKSGLLHHFGNRDGLLRAVAEDGLHTFRADVRLFLDLSENTPGKMIRAYIRALCGGSESAMRFFGFSTLWTTLSEVPGIEELFDEDARYWRTAFAEDGLHPDRILLLRRAAEGVAAASVYEPDLTAAEIDRSRSLFLGLSADNSPLT